jgi:hypothetical protein
MDDSLLKKLVASSSFESLLAEEFVQSAFRHEGWRAFQSTYYRDLATRKLREVDVLARRSWWSDDFVRLTLEIIVEVKTLRGYHLLFSPYTHLESARELERPDASGHLMRRWIGAEGDTRDARIRYLRIEDLSLAKLVREHIAQVAYENGRSVLSPLMIDPPPFSCQAGAFRETNTQVEKDLESSVLWKGVLALMSATKGLIAARLRSRLMTARSFAAANNLSFFSTIASELKDAVRTCDQFHPVFVTDARLWMLVAGGRELSAIPWTRLILSSGQVHPHFWLDVVNREHIADYCTTLTQGYDAILEANGAEEALDEFLF